MRNSATASVFQCEHGYVNEPDTDALHIQGHGSRPVVGKTIYCVAILNCCLHKNFYKRCVTECARRTVPCVLNFNADFVTSTLHSNREATGIATILMRRFFIRRRVLHEMQTPVPLQRALRDVWRVSNEICHR